VGSGVRTVGCLTGAGDVDAHARQRARATKNPTVSTGPDADRARDTAGFEDDPADQREAGSAAEAGTKVEVKGALSVVGLRTGSTVMSLQVVAPTCE
jgi:hypothetical protein